MKSTLAALLAAIMLAAVAMPVLADNDAIALDMRGSGAEISYLPGIALSGAPESSTLMLTRDARTPITNWFSLGSQNDVAYQLGGMPPQAGAWVSSVGGLVPRFGFNIGPLRADVGALLGVGGMLRTNVVAGTADVLQMRGLWTLEPRLEVGIQNDEMGASLLGGYLFTSSQSDFGGLVIGLKATFGGHGHQAMSHYRAMTAPSTDSIQP